MAWITEQKNTLSAVFYLGAMLVYLRFDQTRKMSLYLGALGLFVLALLSKTVIVTLPAALLVIFWWQRGRLSWRRDVLPLMPFFLVGMAAGVLTAWVERKLSGREGHGVPAYARRALPDGGPRDLVLSGQALLACGIDFHLPALACQPGGLVAISCSRRRRCCSWRRIVGAAAAMARAAGGAVFFVGTLFPVLGFLNVFPFTYSFVADHFQYLASLGVITLVSAGVALLLGRWRLWGRPAGYAVCLHVAGDLGVSDLAAEPDVRRHRNTLPDDHRQKSRLLDGPQQPWPAPGRPRTGGRGHRPLSEGPGNQARLREAYDNLGVVLADRGQVDEAIAHYREGAGNQARLRRGPLNLGQRLAGRRQVDEAIAHYRKALEIKPDYAEAHYDLGRSFGGPRTGRRGHRPLSEGAGNQADYAEAHNNLGVALAGRGHFDEAIAHFQQAVEIKPDDAEFHYNLGLALQAQEKIDDAVAQYQEALKIKPDYAAAHGKLADLLAARNNLDEAVRHYLVALRLDPHSVLGHTNWADF